MRRRERQALVVDQLVVCTSVPDLFARISKSSLASSIHGNIMQKVIAACTGIAHGKSSSPAPSSGATAMLFMGCDDA